MEWHGGAYVTYGRKGNQKNYVILHLVWGEVPLFTSPEENVTKKLYETTSGGG